MSAAQTPQSRLVALLDSAAFARAYAMAAFVVTFGAVAIQNIAGLTTLATMVVGLCVIGIAVLVVRRRELSMMRFVPTTLVLFVAWAGASLLLPTHMSTSAKSWIALVGFAVVALVVAHTRDTLQTVRALGDALRLLLLLSLFVEILSGVLLDMPFHFLGVKGDIAVGGPIQGLFGTRNLLGLVAVLATITFVIELRTHSVPRPFAWFSIALGVFMAAGSASPTVLVLVVATAAASAALALVRNTPPGRRPRLQLTFGILVAVALAVAWFARDLIVQVLGAGSDFRTRTTLWDSILDYVAGRPWQGYGWRGPWDVNDPTSFPYTAINATGKHHASALNAYFDVLLQLGAVGLLLFLLMCGIALVRAWSVASERRSVLYAWTPLVLVTLLVDSMFESFTIHGAAWMLLVLCAVRAGQSRSWRELVALARPNGPALSTE